MDRCSVRLLKLVACVLIVRNAGGQSPCDQAPTPTLRKICYQLQKADVQARDYEHAPPYLDPACHQECDKDGCREECAGWGAAGGGCISYEQLHDCVNLVCVCLNIKEARCNETTGRCYLGNSGTYLDKSVRREYRVMLDADRERFHRALRKLKEKGVYDQFVSTHSSVATAGGAHAGPGFLGWHRDFVNKLELELIVIDPLVSLPYWDSTLDGGLPNPADSMLWSDELMGRTNLQGHVISGLATNWRDTNGTPVTRRLGVDRTSRLFQEADLTFYLGQRRIDRLLSYNTAGRRRCPMDWDAFEVRHGLVHSYVGGHMEEPTVSSNDPIFFLHHAFVDFIWELWRQQHQTERQRESEYPDDRPECASSYHMRWNNQKRLWSYYTTNLYSYAPRPTCEEPGTTCKSRFLFCDRSHGRPRCLSKVRLGGNCESFVNGEDVCYQGQCRCINNAGERQPCRCDDGTLDQTLEPPVEANSNPNDEVVVAQARQRLQALSEAFNRALSTGNQQDFQLILNQMSLLRSQVPFDVLRRHPELYQEAVNVLGPILQRTG